MQARGIQLGQEAVRALCRLAGLERLMLDACSKGLHPHHFGPLSSLTCLTCLEVRLHPHHMYITVCSLIATCCIATQPLSGLVVGCVLMSLH